jgi:UDP-N-acetylmuramate dehydrogenase
MTELTDFQREISKALPDVKLLFWEPLQLHTSFRIGGPAEVMAFPSNCEQLAALLKVSDLLDTEPVILGAGTNILAPDAGLPGLVICLKDALSGIEQLGDTCIRVDAGVTMTRAAVYAAGCGLSGMEFAHGIPGTIGGGV